MSSTEGQRISGIAVDIDQNPYLAEGAGTVDAIVSVAIGDDILDLTLRLWTPAGARVVFVKQVAPTLEDLTHRRVDSGNQSGEYLQGAWGAGEERDYHIRIEVEPAAVGREKLAARVTVSAGGETLGEGLVKAIWTADTAQSARINRGVAHYTGQAELAREIQDGSSAYDSGDVATAAEKWRRALELAVESGNYETARLLRQVIEIDERTGTARLRREIAPADEMALDARSTRTARLRKEP
jgi:von Willebrand factor type A C-terminal domain